MISFEKKVMRVLESGQEMSLGDKLIVHDVIGLFKERYRDATGEDPRGTIHTMQLVAQELEEYGFVLPIVDSWRDDNWEIINEELTKRGYPAWFDRRK